MSAFFISEVTMHRCVEAMRPDTSADEGTALGQDLYGLNIEALRRRYPGIIGTQEEADYQEQRGQYRFRPQLASKVARFKALCCLQYQCSEGDVPEHDLFQTLERRRHEIADDIVCDLPEYESVAWD